MRVSRDKPKHLRPLPFPTTRIEAATRREALTAELRRIMTGIGSLIGQGHHLLAFKNLEDAGKAAEDKYALIESDPEAICLLADLWRMAGEEGVKVLKEVDTRGFLKPERVMATLQRAQELYRSFGKDSEARKLDEYIDFINQRAHSIYKL